jgi:hypothetical protein
LGGDIVTFDRINYARDFFSYVGDHFEEVFWVPGNHEYYHGNIAERSGRFEEKITANVTLLNNSIVTTKGVKLIFSTLWSAISPTHAWQIERGLNDFEMIRNGDMRFTTIRSQELHGEAVQFLTDTLCEPAQEPRIVVTHHLPTFRHYPDEYAGNILNEAFASPLDSLIESTASEYWLYGHHHRNIEEYQIGRTKMLTNQLGYLQKNEHRTFRRDAILHILPHE